MADYIYTLETRLTPDQQKTVALVLDAAKAAGMNLYLTGGAIRVCPICGHTVIGDAPDECPVCGTAGQFFKTF